jgi:hypothetical protein
MKIRMVFYVLAGAMVLAAGVSADVGAETEAAPVPRAMDVGGGKAEARCEEMMQMRQETMARMDTLNASLKAKLAKLKASKGKARVKGLSEMVEVLAAQNKVLQEAVESGLPGMMAHMMTHRQGSGSQGKQISMADCPMMKSISGGVTHPTGKLEFTRDGLLDRR